MLQKETKRKNTFMCPASLEAGHKNTPAFRKQTILCPASLAKQGTMLRHPLGLLPCFPASSEAGHIDRK